MHVAFLVWFGDFKEGKMLKEALRMRMESMCKQK